MYCLVASRMTVSEFWDSITDTSTAFINGLCYPFVNWFGFDYLSLMLFFAFIGFIGFILLYESILVLIPYNSKLGRIKLFPFLLFLPNLHLWSVAVGKDSLLFFCVCALIYSFLNVKKRVVLMVLASILIYRIRMHVALIAVIASGIAYFLQPKFSIFIKIFMTTIAFAIGVALAPVVFEKFGVEEISVDAAMEKFDTFADVMSYGGSAVDISEYSYPLKFLTFWFRPFFFFDRMKIADIIISFENLISILLLIKVMRSRPVRAFKKAPFTIQFALIFAVVGSLIFCQVMSNLGLIIRQRNIFFICVLLYYLWVLSYNKQPKQRK